jgi:hypothetical protein
LQADTTAKGRVSVPHRLGRHRRHAGAVDRFTPTQHSRTEPGDIRDTPTARSVQPIQ